MSQRFDDFDTRLERDLEREPSYRPRARQRIPLTGRGSLKTHWLALKDELVKTGGDK
jgi:hypothetical protein